MRKFDVSFMEVELLEDSADCSKGEYFCELCSLDFTTQDVSIRFAINLFVFGRLNFDVAPECFSRSVLCQTPSKGMIVYFLTGINSFNVCRVYRM